MLGAGGGIAADALYQSGNEVVPAGWPGPLKDVRGFGEWTLVTVGIPVLVTCTWLASVTGVEQLELFESSVSS